MLARVYDQEIEIGEGPMPPPRELASAVRASSSRPERWIGLNSENGSCVAHRADKHRRPRHARHRAMLGSQRRARSNIATDSSASGITDK